MKTSLTCILCPKSCLMTIIKQKNGHYEVQNAVCKKGAEYAREEMDNPQRTLTSTVKVTGGIESLASVRTDRPIPQKKLFEAMAIIREKAFKAPVSEGQILIHDFIMKGVNLIATSGTNRQSKGTSNPLMDANKIL